jgi:hypothetical protein
MTNQGKDRSWHPVELDCGHTMDFESPCPVAGEVITCVACREDGDNPEGVTVLRGYPVLLRLRCEDCRYSVRITGDDPTDYLIQREASMKVTGHHRRRPRHTLGLYDHRRLLQEFPAIPQQVAPF